MVLHTGALAKVTAPDGRSAYKATGCGTGNAQMRVLIRSPVGLDPSTWSASAAALSCARPGAKYYCPRESTSTNNKNTCLSGCRACTGFTVTPKAGGAGIT